MVKLGVLSLMIAVVSACGLYGLKHRVHRLEGELRRAERSIVEEQVAITRLRAEWATLSEPARLARLAETYLELRPAGPRQIARIEDIPLRQDADLNRKSFPALVRSGVEVPLKFKPSRTLNAAQQLYDAELARQQKVARR